MITQQQYDELLDEFTSDDEPAESDEVFAPIESLWRLHQQCNASAASDVGRSIQAEARLSAVIAATALCGGDYRGEHGWFDAVQDLVGEQQVYRREEWRNDLLDNRQTPDADLDAWFRADARLLERINHALRSYYEQLAEEIEQEQEDAMRLCNRCNAPRADTVNICTCGCPEFRIEDPTNSPTKETTMRTVTAKPKTKTEPDYGKANQHVLTFTAWQKHVATLVDWPDEEFRRRNDELLDLYHSDLSPAAAVSRLDDIPATQQEAAAKEAAASNGAKPKARKRRKTPASDAPPATATEQMLPVSAISLRTDNPRQSIDPAELEQLAAAIKADGLQNRIVVAEVPDAPNRYEVWQGERRFRAMRDLLQWQEIPVRIDAGSPAELVCRRALENLTQGSLNPIERAQSYRQMIDSGRYPSQKQLAEDLQISAGELSNRLRLLELPEGWQQRVISGEMPPGHARFLAPYAELPTVLKSVEKKIAERKRWSRSPEECYGRQPEFQRDVGRSVCECSRPMGGGEEWTGHRRVRCRLTKAQKADERLDVRTVTIDGKSEPRAFNVALWDKLNTEREQQLAQRRAGKEKSAAARQELTPAEKRERTKRQREQHQKKLYRYKTAWLQQAISARIGLGKMSDDLLLKVLLKFACSERYETRRTLLGDAVSGHAGTVKTRQDGYMTRGVDPCASLATFPLDRMGSCARSCVGRWIQQPFEGTRPMITPREIEAIAADLSIDLAAEWRCDEAFLSLHTTAQLKALAREWQMMESTATKRADLQAFILAQSKDRPQPLPKSLAKLKPVAL